MMPSWISQLQAALLAAEMLNGYHWSDNNLNRPSHKALRRQYALQRAQQCLKSLKSSSSRDSMNSFWLKVDKGSLRFSLGSHSSILKHTACHMLASGTSSNCNSSECNSSCLNNNGASYS